MDTDYDCKFEEMKKYIPFLESMIKRLESTNNLENNPRKAQLDKIRSLRDLLMDKKKRMKMENLLKCEQVLINLYAKVEQRDSMVDVNKESPQLNQNENSNLSLVRNKLKSVVSKLHEEVPDTLPEIAGPTNTEVDCTPGSKEPALFQRRPNKTSLSPSHESQNRLIDDKSSTSQRHYTRVLMSPEPKKNEWPTKEANAEKPLFSRRSPRRSPRRYSPSYKKERKKPSKQRSKSKQETKDLNITLKVPEESLNSLNTKDILSRIINCSDSDVDIDTLRGLRSQILGELKQTGAKDDISDLILKSYKNKDKQSKKSDEVEEGELSDSESETIENIYGSLVVVNKDDKNSSTSKDSQHKQQPRKIQICLVINADKENEKKVSDHKINATLDISDFEAFTEGRSSNNSIPQETATDKKAQEKRQREDKDKKKREETKNKGLSKLEDGRTRTPDKSKSNVDCKNEISNSNKSKSKDEKLDNIKSSKNAIDNIDRDKNDKTTNKKIGHEKVNLSEETFTPNFYQPVKEDETNLQMLEKESALTLNNVDSDDKNDNISKLIEMARNVKANSCAKNQVKQDTVSEIDILQALKKEILSETVTVPEAITPPLHQPKISKVASSQEISSKKRISIENYKQKSAPPIQQPLFTSEQLQRTSKDDSTKKQSLKLTEKECERFNFLTTFPPTDSSDDEDESSISIDEIYANLAPKSPDHDDFADTGIKPPVIIPSDPVKNVVVNSKVDIDMRTIMRSTVTIGPRKSPLVSNEKGLELSRNEKTNINENLTKSMSDVRIRTETNHLMVNNSPNSYTMSSDRSLRPSMNYPNVTPNISPNIAANIPPLMSMSVAQNLTPTMAPIMNPNKTLTLNSNISQNMTPVMNPNMTPVLNPSMTPSRNPGMVHGINQMITQMMTPNSRSYELNPRSNFDNDEYTNRKHVYAPTFATYEPYELKEKDTYTMQGHHWEINENSVQRDVDYQRHRNDLYNRDTYRLDSPQIRMDCPATPNPSFGRMEGPMTPVHSFGRTDCPMTPSHPFGRNESNLTPTNVFGRGDYHQNQSVSNLQYIKSHDPRLNRSSEYDSFRGRNEERNRSHYKDMSDDNKKFMRNRDNSYDQSSRSNKERMSDRETTRGGRSLTRDYDCDKSYKNDYNSYEYRYSSKKSKDYDEFNKSRNYRAKSISRFNASEDSFSSPRVSGIARTFPKEFPVEKTISVQSHFGRSFNIDTSFNRTFQDTKSSSMTNTSFDARRQRATSVGRSLREYEGKDVEKTTTINNKYIDTPERRNANFRRACSVGRDLVDYNSDRSFKDIKADLRSCKFEDYNRKLRDRDDRTKPSISNKHFRERSKESKSDSATIDKNSECSKYSPRKNIRDPRLRRDVDITLKRRDKYKDKDRNQGSSHYKNYGIVYSNDNIAKGTILASAAGVRNFKIPKIKRPVNEKELNVNKTCQDKSDDAVKDIIGNDENPFDNIKSVQGKKKDIKEKISLINKRVNGSEKDSTTPTLQNIETPNKLEVTSSTKKYKNRNSNNDTNSISISCESRITRSATKSQSTISNDMPIGKRLRRIKRPVIYDSDSDSLSPTTEGKKKQTKEMAKKEIESKDIGGKADFHKKETRQNNLNIDELKNKVENTKTDKRTKNIEINKNLIVQTMQRNATEEMFKNEDNNISNTDIREVQPSSITSHEIGEEQNDSLDISFGVDDEFLSQNITSGSVLDNINALIADLDHDIEAPKINDFNDKFIKNLMGSISSNDSPIPLEVNERDFASDNEHLISEKQVPNDSMDTNKTNINTKAEDGTVKINAFDIANKRNAQDSSDLRRSGEQTVTKEMKEQNMEGTVVTVKEDCNNIPVKLDEQSSKINDNIVTTTENTGNVDEEVVRKKAMNMPCHIDMPGQDFFIPDSTDNLNEAINNVTKDFQLSVPDSTNEVRSDMHSDITSTHNAFDNFSKEQSVATSSYGDNIAPIDSIGKLLSILEDKNKIKELLTMLGNDSSENEKIKKKLEKLSEIVSDEEHNKGLVKNELGQTCNQPVYKNKENDESTTAYTSVTSSDNNEDNSKKGILDSLNILNSSNPNTDDLQKDVEKKMKIQNMESIEINAGKLEENVVKNTVKSDAVENSKNEVENEVLDTVKDVELNVVSEITAEVANIQKDIDIDSSSIQKPTKKNLRKSKITKKGRPRLAKRNAQNKIKRVIGTETVISQTDTSPAPKKVSRELLKLQEDIREMFISEDILNATGIRMCRLAKMVDDKKSKSDTQVSEVEPVVVLEKMKGKNIPDVTLNASKSEKSSNKCSNAKPIANCQSVAPAESKNKGKSKYKSGPKTKTKNQVPDAFDFETESIAESNNTVDSRDQNTGSESDSDSTKSFGSSELLVELKKKTKRKRPSWKLGVIRSKNGKKRNRK